jgi:hypothetical protein
MVTVRLGWADSAWTAPRMRHAAVDGWSRLRSIRAVITVELRAVITVELRAVITVGLCAVITVGLRAVITVGLRAVIAAELCPDGGHGAPGFGGPVPARAVRGAKSCWSRRLIQSPTPPGLASMYQGTLARMYQGTLASMYQGTLASMYQGTLASMYQGTLTSDYQGSLICMRSPPRLASITSK